VSVLYIISVSNVVDDTVVGGFVGDRLLTREGLIQYSQLSTVSELHCCLGELLVRPVVHSQHLMTYQQTLLASSLDRQSSSSCVDQAQPDLSAGISRKASLSQ